MTAARARGAAGLGDARLAGHDASVPGGAGVRRRSRLPAAAIEAAPTEASAPAAPVVPLGTLWLMGLGVGAVSLLMQLLRLAARLFARAAG